jgi:F-box interacting protein
MAEAAGGAPQLPEDLIIWEILTRLPVKPVLRCRAVCRSWRRCLTSDAKFLRAHHSRQPSLPLVTTQEGQEKRIDAMDHRAGERRPVARTTTTTAAAEDLDVLASCDGLLVLIAHGGLYICNPATRPLAPLPLLSRVNCIAGLYPHRPSGSYRVLCCVETDGRAVYHVHALGSCELRCVGEPPEPWASGDVVTMMPMMEFLNPHVLAGGRLYWHPLKLPVKGSGKVNNMLVFDTIAESFRHVMSPVDGACIELFETTNATLGLYDYNGATADLWVLQDYERWVWSLKHRIKLQMMPFFLLPDTNSDMIVLSEKGENTGLRWQYLQNISGIDGSSLTRYEWNVFLKLEKLRFKQSLVRHPFFSMEDNNDGAVDEKPLFEGLSTVTVDLDDDYEPHTEESMVPKSAAGASHP